MNAKEIIEMFEDLLNPDRDTYKCTECKDAALIAVDLVIRALTELDKYEYVPEHVMKEWSDIKNEIDNGKA